MKSEREILDALRTIQDVCVDMHGNCEKCVLRNDNNECSVIEGYSGCRESPQEWKLKPDNYIPRLILD